MPRTENSDEMDEPGTRSRSKVAKLIHQHNLTGIGDELERYWTMETDERMSLRDLADYFNRALLAQALQQNGTSVLDGEVANYYRLLSADDVSSGMRVQAENQLERHGVDVEQLVNDFVSRQAIHTYLTEEREATYNDPDRSSEERSKARIETIGRLKSRLVAVAERTISELGQSNSPSNTDARVTVLVQVQCSNCETQYPITEYLTRGGCECRSTND